MAQRIPEADALDTAGDEDVAGEHCKKVKRLRGGENPPRTPRAKLAERRSGEASGNDNKRGGTEMRIALLVVAGLALIGFLVVAVVLPQMEGSRARGAAEALIAGADPARQQVAAAAEKSGSLAGAGGGVKVASKTDPEHGELKWLVGSNGAVRGWNDKNAIEVTFTPSLEGGKVVWTCRGYPVSAMPAQCGGN